MTWHPGKLDADGEPMLPLDPTCPHCHYPCDIGEIFDGGSHRCEDCGALLQATAFGPSPQRPHGFMLMTIERLPPQKPLTGRQRTRRRWARQGRR